MKAAIRRGAGEHEPGAGDGTRDAHVADDAVDLSHTVWRNGVALLCQRRARGRHEHGVDRRGDGGVASEDEVRPESVAFADVEDRALGAGRN